ncbi:divergent polysaccharide deacetylase family protein [Salipiger thiooxidans]|uniref:divergent polysaccharide deacetylase family protein n=1 Tax=Salipiger thiooxidans TaxID=282683 RepID=UPI001CD532A5|nr:divergent polysaccharide deacetylase family protein [Salipiger thiooxidans]MCA0847653.1 divergent polysaccharide deacetylase family protein [Salipiger thiooxidans]
MAKGFVAGVLIGTVVSVAGAGALSIAMGSPERALPNAEPEVAAVPGAEGAEPIEGAISESPEIGETVAEGGVATETAEVVSEPVPDADVADAPALDGAMAEPVAEAEAEVGDTASPVAEVEPETEVEETAKAEPATEAEVEVVTTEPALDDTPPETVTELDAPVAPDAPDTAPEPVVAAADTPQRGEATSPVPEAPEAEASPELATETAEPPMPAPYEVATSEPEVEAVPEVVVLPQTEGETRPAIGTPAGSLIGRDGTGHSDRLPSIGEDTAVPADGTGGLRPLDVFSAPSNLTPGEPHMSIVLIDDGSGPLGPETVGEFPFPVSFALSPSHPDAIGAARAYREEGFEVLTMASAPEGAQASDVEISLEGALGAVPEAIGVLEAPGDGLQATREISDQAARFLHASGHGLVMLPKGLNTGQALALREGVPSATVFRDFDGEGQDPRVMRRFLDQAAFKARQEGPVVMLGRLRADTVSALLLWGLQDRASSVELVPVSAILRESVE